MNTKVWNCPLVRIFPPESELLPNISSGPDDGVPEVTVCGVESSIVHVTVSPTLICTGLGLYAFVVNEDEPGGMATFVSSDLYGGVEVWFEPV